MRNILNAKIGGSIISLIDSDKTLSYSFCSSVSKTGKEAKQGLSKDNSHWFDSNHDITTAPFFWQISFPKFVIASKYCICTSTPGTVLYVSSWELSYSLDGINFNTLQVDSISRYDSSASYYNIEKKVKCKHFKITTKTTSNGLNDWLAHRKFDIYGIMLGVDRSKFEVKQVRYIPFAFF